MQRAAKPRVVTLPDPDDPNGIDLVGECAEFCAYLPFGRGIPVEHHGPLCLSEPCGREVDGALADGSDIEVTLELARPYRNGRYREVVATRLRDTRLVRLTTLRSDLVGADGEVEIFLSSGDALRLAAELVTASRRLDRLGF